MPASALNEPFLQTSLRRRPRRLFLFGSLGLALLLAAPSDGAAPKRPKSKPPAEVIQPALLRQHTAALTQGELADRRLGTTGAQAAQRYVAEQLGGSGLRPGGDAGFLQAVPLSVARPRRVGAVTLRAVSTSIPVSIAVTPTDLLLLPGPGERSAALREAPMVFVGYGVSSTALSWDDYKGADVRGKVVVVLDGDPPIRGQNEPVRHRQGQPDSKIAEAARRGALAVLLLPSERLAGVPLALVRSAWETAVFEPSAARAASPPPIRGLISEDAARRIVQASSQDWDTLRRGADTSTFAPVQLTVRLSAQLAAESQPLASANVVGLLPGRDPRLKREAVVLTAHLDEPPTDGATPAAPGARASAVGVAALLSMAQAAGQGPAPRRTLVFAALTAHSAGSLGVARLLTGLSGRGLKPIAHLDLDALPVGASAPAVIQIGRGKSNLDAQLDAVAKLQKRQVTPEPYAELGLFYRSDSARFAEAGIPSLFLGAADLGRFLREELGRPQDTLNPAWTLAGTAEDARLLYQTALRIADANQAPAFLPSDEYAPR